MSAQRERGLVITHLEVENVKRIRAVQINPDRSLVLIGGRNAQGKSSILDSIEMLLRGQRAVPAEPVRRGASQAHIRAHVGESVDSIHEDMTIERRFVDGKSELEVKVRGIAQRGPQGVLNELFGGEGNGIAFDPMEFARMDPPKQDALLKRVLGLDFTELDQARDAAYADRKEWNRRIKSLKGQLDGLPQHQGAPAEETSLTELTQRLRTGQEHLRARDKAEDRMLSAIAQHREGKARVAELEAQLEQAKLGLSILATAEAEARAAHSGFAPVDIEAIERQIATADETNRKVRENAARKKVSVELEAAETASAELTDELAEIEEKKAAMLAAAQFPVPGLGFDETGPTLNGLPLEQASQSERIRISIAIAFALNPKLRVLLVRNGSDLDQEALQLLAELADEQGGQVWIERVSEEGCAIVIEDGTVKDASAAE